MTAEKKEKRSREGFCRVCFRPGSPPQTAVAAIGSLSEQAVVMVRTDHGMEPAVFMEFVPAVVGGAAKEAMPVMPEVVAAADEDECQRYASLQLQEAQAHENCNQLIEKHQLSMKLVRVERFFDGSKIIFYFTAESRVDFRALVKDLVQRFRTRIEMRQIGVRHETRMLGGLGPCGREFCCSSHLNTFSSVSIKMAKEQDLPLNPNKISGVCNRLFCCLAHEYTGYKEIRRKMPRPGRKISINKESFIVRRQDVIRHQLIVENSAGEELVLDEKEWGMALVREQKTREFRPHREERG